MVDLTDICGDDAQVISLLKKKGKALEKLQKIEEKAAPVRADIQMYDDMIAAIMKRAALNVPAVSDAPLENPTA